jgi:hypothetical protein
LVVCKEICAVFVYDEIYPMSMIAKRAKMNAVILVPVAEPPKEKNTMRRLITEPPF